MSEVEALISSFSDLNVKSDLEKINNRISNEVCFKTIDKISDSNLIEDYKKSKSVIKEVDKLEKILETISGSFEDFVDLNLNHFTDSEKLLGIETFQIKLNQVVIHLL
jgi:hypothetical protein